MNVTRDIQRTRNTPEEYGITSQGQNRSTEWIKKNRVRFLFSSSRVDFTNRRQKRKSKREGRERERKKRKKEKESEEALIKPAARRVIKTRARPRDPDGSSGAYRHAGDFPSYARHVIGICEIGRDTADLHSRKDSERLERRLKRAPALHNEDVRRARRFG